MAFSNIKMEGVIRHSPTESRTYYFLFSYLFISIDV